MDLYLLWLIPALCLVLMIGMMVMMFRHAGCMRERRARCCGTPATEPNSMKEPS
jgi:cytochrome c-type biogenesis protein CcmH/NrfF